MQVINIILLHDVRPSVKGHQVRSVETGQLFEVLMDDLYGYMNIYTKKAESEAQFNFEIGTMSDKDLCMILQGMQKIMPEKFETIQDHPMVASDHYTQYPTFDEIEHTGQRPDDFEQFGREMIEIINANRVIGEMKITSEDLAAQVRELIEKSQQIIDSISIGLDGEPTTYNLLDGYKVIRRCIRKDKVESRWVRCSNMWLDSKISEQQIQSLMNGDVIQATAKSNKGNSNYELKRVKIYRLKNA